jgi:hypothetical protein
MRVVFYKKMYAVSMDWKNTTVAGLIYHTNRMKTNFATIARFDFSNKMIGFLNELDSEYWPVFNNGGFPKVLIYFLSWLLVLVESIFLKSFTTEIVQTTKHIPLTEKVLRHNTTTTN